MEPREDKQLGPIEEKVVTVIAWILGCVIIACIVVGPIWLIYTYVTKPIGDVALALISNAPKIVAHAQVAYERELEKAREK